MKVLDNLDFSQISAINQPIFVRISDWYDPPVREELLEIAQAVDLINIRNDYLVLLGQIKNILVVNNLISNQSLIDAINKALTEGDYSKAPDYIEKVISLDSPDINSALIPQLSQLCNIYATFEGLNKMPGMDGQAVNLFKLPGLA